ncbi:S-layer homology domain-containing protein [Patescibacteria group bacterium]|nr:S-layer homology domain-containing protein [Patescibacteria group bacterium]
MKILKKIMGNSHLREWIVIITLLAVSTFTLNINENVIRTSLLNYPKHDPFDGTVLPIQNVPDWTHATSAEQKMNYHDFPSSKLEALPEYRNDYFVYPSSSLVWGKASDDVIRNTKITFSVPYAGSYAFGDLGIGSGSHPAVDIKCLYGTPVYAIANGIVTKSTFQSTGFGNHIVIEHQNVPKPGSRTTTTDLLSSYSHLSKIYVSQGDIVRKGQVIGEVGDSGTATTPHLHFQLDNSEAPWNPYWPFTTAEATKAGYTFWDAVSSGLGRDNVYKYTYDPMKWVQDNLNGSVIEVVTNNSTSTTTDTTEIVTPPVVTLPAVEQPISEVIESTETPAVVVNVDFSDISIKSSEFVLLSNNETVYISLLDAAGNTISVPNFDGEISVSLNDGEIAKLNRNFLTKNDFKNGKAELYLYAEREGQVRLNFDIANKHFESDFISLISSVQPFARFGVTVDGLFTPRVAESVIVQALDANGNPTPIFNSAGNIELSTIQGSGVFSKDVLTAADFKNGVAEVDFYGDSDEDVVILALYGRARAESKLMHAKLFTDLSRADENYTAVSYLFKKGTVQGYPDGTFQPTKTVTRVEALKFIFSGMDKDLVDNANLYFRDTVSTEWYAPFIATAQSLGIVEGYSDGTFKPSQGVNRVEFLKMLFSTIDLEIDPIITEAPYEDVNTLSWYAAYVNYAKEKNLFPVEGNYFNPSSPMDRSEVAELIYRLLIMIQNNADQYSDDLPTS